MLELAADLSVGGREDGDHQKEGAQDLTGERVLSLNNRKEGGREEGRELQ